MNVVATTFALEPVCNANRAAHALRSDQYLRMSREVGPRSHVCNIIGDSRLRLSLRKVIRRRVGEKEKEKNEFSGHYVCLAASLQHQLGTSH